MTHESKRVQPPASREKRSSKFEKRGGYPSSAQPVGQLPRVRPGPGPGAKKPVSNSPSPESPSR